MAETLPPLDPSDIQAPLQNPTFSVYIYVGNETDSGWRVANIVYGLLARIRIYCITKPELARTWTPDGAEDYEGGIVFGWGPTPVEYLSKRKAGNLEQTLKAIQAARA